LFPERLVEQTLALGLFLVVPFNHSIHHYRDVPVVLASSAVFLLAAHWLRFSPSAGAHHPRRRPQLERGASREPSPEASPRSLGASQSGAKASPGVSQNAWQASSGVLSLAWLGGAMLLGVWSRTEVLTFAGVLVLAGLIVWRRAVLPLAAMYVVAGALGLGMFLTLSRLEGVDPAQMARYQVHTFLDSTPESWLTPECRAQPTENCRERDGMTYFGPVVQENGVLPLVLAHPWTTVAKTARSALDNVWLLLGPNISTFPGLAPFGLIALAWLPAARSALAGLSPAAWMVALAALGETVLPPLSWAPPHPQYHQQLIVAVVVVLAPILRAVLQARRGTLVSGGLFAAMLFLSAFRYTRYPGY
jgi:hypothetical protein